MLAPRQNHNNPSRNREGLCFIDCLQIFQETAVLILDNVILHTYFAFKTRGFPKSLSHWHEADAVLLNKAHQNDNGFSSF